MEMILFLFLSVSILVCSTGANNSSNSIASVIATTRLNPRSALLLAASMNLIGSLFGGAVAITISTDVLNDQVILATGYPNAIGHVLCNGVLTAIAWNFLALKLGLPVSSTHALVGGLCGAAISMTGSMDALMWEGNPDAHKFWESVGIIGKVLLPLILAPIIAFVFSWTFMSGLNVILSRSDVLKINRILSPLQILSSAGVAFAHGMNNTPKFMGILLLALTVASHKGDLQQFPGWLSFLDLDDPHVIPLWLLVYGGIFMGIGTLIGGHKVIKNLGRRVVNLKPASGFAAQTSSAIILFVTSIFGISVAANHIGTSSIVGAGLASKHGYIRPRMILSIVKYWMLNFPICFLVGYLLNKWSHMEGWLLLH